MWSIFSDRRRAVAAGAAVVLVVATVVLALTLSPRQPGAAPTASPAGIATGTGTPTPSAAASQPPSETQAPVPSETPSAAAGSPGPAEPAPLPPAPESPAPEPALPAAPFPAALAGRDVEAIPDAGPVVALTFDAGANAAGLPAILQSLAAAGVQGTFFLTGNWAAANPAGVAAIVAGGHRVGNHSMTHPGFTGLSDAAIAEQIVSAQKAIQAVGADPRPLFRFPFGDRDARTIATVNSLGYVPVRWTVDTLGWKGTSGGATAQLVADRVLAGLRPGEIVLMHIGSNPDDGSTLDADALAGIITRIRAAGYGFATLDRLLG